MPYPYYPTRTYPRRVPLPRVISLRPPPQTFTQGLTAGLSFVGGFTASRKYLRSFGATLFGGWNFATGLVSYWKLDEASGTRFDSFGTNHLTDTAGTNGVAGIQGNCAQFQKFTVNNYLSCTSNSTLQMSGNTDFTIACWVQLASSTTESSLVTKDSNAANSRDYTLDYNGSTSSFRFYIKGGATYLATIVPGALWSSWNFLVAWYDSSNGQVHLRMNDSVQGDSPTGATGTDVSSAEFRIGAREYATVEDYALGYIDEVAIWKRLLTSTEITALYNSGAGTTYGSGIATLVRLPRKSLDATLAPVAALIKKITDAGFTAALSFVGAVTKRMTLLRNSFTATLFSGASAGIGTQTVTDDFNRANENPITGNWTNSSLGTFKIVSNAVTVTDVTGNDSEAFYNAWSGGNDQYSQAAITVSGGTPTEGAGVVVRRSTTAGTRTMYRLVLNGSGTWQLDKYITGSRTGLNSGSVTYVAGQKLGLSVQGTTLRVWYNGVQQGASSTDSGIASGSPGLSTSTAFTSCSIDNWDAGSSIGPAATLTRRTGKALSAGLSFVGTFTKNFISGGVLYLQSFTATLFSSPSSFPVSGCTAYYKLEDLTESVGGLTLTNTNSVTFGTGKVNNAANFVAASFQRLTCADAPAFQMGTGDFSFSAWIKFTGNGYSHIAYGTLAKGYFLMARTGTSGLMQISIGDGVNSGAAPSTNVFNDGNWHHYVATYERAGNAKLYVDTVVEINVGITFCPGSVNSVIGHGLSIGGEDDGGTPVDGSIDEVGFWNRALTATEVTTLYNAGAGTTYSTGGGPAAALTKQTGKALSATWSPVAALAKKLGRALSATLSFVGALTKRSTRSLSATLSFIGNLATNLIHGGTLFTQSLVATLSFVGAINVKQIATRAFTATLSFVGTSSRRAGKLFTPTLTQSATLLKRIADAGFTATLSFVATLTKRISDAGFSATLAFSAVQSASKSFLKSLTATLSFIGAMTPKQILTRAFTATLSFTGAMSRSTGKAFSATLSTAASLAKRISRTFSGTASLSGSLVKFVRDAGFTATLSFVGNLVGVAAHFFTRAFTATLSFSATLTRFRLVQRVFAATLAFSGAFSRRIGKAFSATLAFSTAARKVVQKVLRGTLAFVGFFFKGGAITVLAGWITKCFATIGVGGSTVTIVRAGSQLTVVQRGSGAKIQVTGSTLRVERTK